MTTTPTFNALSVVCPNDTCKARVDELCKAKSGKRTKTPHRARVLAAGGTPPKLGKPVKARPKRTVKKVIDKPGINSATVGEFMDDLEKLREKWHLDDATMIAVRDPESKRTLTAAHDKGAWLVTMGG